uniref:translation initiation factor IF-2-like n=1 Tax=Callithrix jacchus TaxID=9483 RepID=UPI0023DD4D87|nr:translation initiation factor IF-2-like [Callithrix jacchus]
MAHDDPVQQFKKEHLEAVPGPAPEGPSDGQHPELHLPREAAECLPLSARRAPGSPLYAPLSAPHCRRQGGSVRAEGTQGVVGKRPCGEEPASWAVAGGSVCSEAPPAPSAGRSPSVWMSAASSEPARTSQRGSGGGRRAAGGGRRGGEEARRGREEGKQGGREGGEEDPESARQLEFLQRLAGLQCTAAASRGGSRQPGSSGGGRASGGPSPCPLQTLLAASPGVWGRAREARLGQRPSSPPPQRQPPSPPPQPRASPGSRRRLQRPPSPGPWALPGESPGRGGGCRGVAGRWLQGGGRCCPERRAEAPRALPGGSPVHSPRRGSGPTGQAWAARSDAAVPAWHQGHLARGGGDEGGQPRVATAAPESSRRSCSGSGAGWRKGVFRIDPHFPTFLLDITPTLDAARGAVKHRRL